MHGMYDPCSLGHFYENNRCIYCDGQLCLKEFGGHSFETAFWADERPQSPAYCYHCQQNLVNLVKVGTRKRT